jgi:hypothetical protein
LCKCLSGMVSYFILLCFQFSPAHFSGAKLVRDAFDLAKEKIKEGNRKGAIIFIDELDAIGSFIVSQFNVFDIGHADHPFSRYKAFWRRAVGRP